MKRLAALFVDCASIVFFALMIFYGHKILAVVGRQLSPAMELSMAIPYSAICAGGSLMFLYAAEHALGVLVGGEGPAS